MITMTAAHPQPNHLTPEQRDQLRRENLELIEKLLAPCGWPTTTPDAQETPK